MKLLLATDHSRHARAAVELLDRIPLPAGSSIVVLSVLEESEPFSSAEAIADDERDAYDDIERTLRAEVEAVANEEAARLEGHGLQATATTRRGKAHEEILSAAEEFGVDTIVIGALGVHAKGKRPLGRTARKVVQRAPCSVLVTRVERADIGEECDADAIESPAESPAESQAKSQAGATLTVLVAFDDSEPANEALQVLGSLESGATLDVTVLTVLTVATTLFRKDILQRLSETWQVHMAKAEQRLGEVVEKLRDFAPATSAKLLDGGPDPTDEIIDAATLLDADLLMVGDTGKGGVERVLLGSVSSQLVEFAKCSVWVVKLPPARDE